jgi:hypothetical protein
MANFQYNPPFPAVVPGDQSTFTRTYEHRNWVDGQDMVQAGTTPDELGMNARLNALEADLDAVKADLVQSYKLISDLRKALAVALGQIQSELNKKTDKQKEGKDSKDGKETKETKDAKDGKETKESKDGKETKETKEHKDGKETKEHKEEKDGKEGLNAVERLPLAPPEGQPPGLWAASDENANRHEGAADVERGRAFIRIDERPNVGDRILAREPQPPSFAP